MNGNLEYNLLYQKKIQKIINEVPSLAGFYSFMLAADSSITTAYNYLRQIKNFLSYVDKPLSQLTLDDFTGYSLSKGIKLDGELITSSYKIQIYQALKKYGKYLAAKGILKQNPMQLVDRPIKKDSQKTIAKRQIGYLEKEEIKNVVQTTTMGVGSKRSQARQKEWKERDLAIIFIFLNTGIRASALYKLDVTSIDLTKQILIVTDKENTVNEHSLSNETIQIINAWLIKREELLAGTKEEALFISNQRKRMCTQAITNVVKKYSVNITGKNITPHKLRATYGTQLYESTRDIYFVQQCMKHASPGTTELYIRTKQNHTAEASDIMAELLSN